MKKVKEYINVPSEQKWDNKKISRSKKRIKKAKKKWRVVVRSKNLTRILNKYRRWENLFKYEEDYLRKKLIEKADLWFSRFIRRRDKDSWCITNSVSWCSNKVENACHRLSRWRYSHRWREDNVFGWCVSCNAYHQQEHWAVLERIQITKYWMDWVVEQYDTRNKKKPTIDELLAIIDKYQPIMEKIYSEL